MACENKYYTLTDLARQAQIISGDTACFDGKIQAGIPFSGYSTGVDTSTIGLLNGTGAPIISESAYFSGTTGTTIYDISNPLSPNFVPSFAPYSATSWTNPIFSAGTSGLHTVDFGNPSAQTTDFIWTFSETGMTGDHVINTYLTGYSITYDYQNLKCFPDIPSVCPGFTGLTTGTKVNYSAGTLDYKGPVDYLRSREDGTIDNRLTTKKLKVTGGASASTIGFVLTQTDSEGTAEWVFNSASASTNTFVVSGSLDGNADLNLLYNTGGAVPPIDLSALSGATFTGNTSGDCISDLFVTNIHGCSPITFHSPLQHIGSSATGLNSIAWGSGNSTSDNFSNILGGQSNSITGNSAGCVNNTIVGGSGNTLSGFGSATSDDNIILGGLFNSMSARTIRSAIIGGEENIMGSHSAGTTANAVIVGGIGNVFPGLISAPNSVIVGGTGITALTSNTVYMNNLEVTQGNALIDYDHDGDTRINIKNRDGGLSARTVVSLGAETVGGTEISGGMSYMGPTYGANSHPTFKGEFLPNSLNITTAGGTFTDRSNINIGSRRQTDAETRFFGGSSDFTASSLLGTFFTTGLTISDMVNTDTLRVRSTPTIGHVLTSDAIGNATWQPTSSSFTGNTSGSCIDELWVTIISGCSPVTIGSSIQSTGYLGFPTIASGVNSIAYGGAVQATGDYSQAFGFATLASGSGSTAFGEETQATGATAHAEGNVSIAGGGAAHAEGSQTKALGDYSHAEGQFTIASGDRSHAEGHSSRASGVGAHAEGQLTIASGDYSHAEGVGNDATGKASHAEGGWSASFPNNFPTSATTDSAHAEGVGTLASGEASHAEGSFTEATSPHSHAEGFGTTATDSGGIGSCHAEGRLTSSLGRASHSEGEGTEASGNRSHAEGSATISSGEASHSEGFGTLASGDYSHAGGHGGDGVIDVIVASGESSFAHYFIAEASGIGVVGARSDYSAILGGTDHDIYGYGSTNIILGGDHNLIDDTSYSSILGGSFNSITGATGTANCDYSTIIGGSHNLIQPQDDSDKNTIIGGSSHEIRGRANETAIIGGVDGTIGTTPGGSVSQSVIIGGSGNVIDPGSSRSVILGGLGIVAPDGDTVYVPTLNIDTTPLLGTGATEVLVRDSADGLVKQIDINTLAFSGGSGNCVTDLYATNIHACSPLNINPLDEGNVYFGSTSGVTIDVINSRIGVGVSVPSEKLHVNDGDIRVENIGGLFFSDLNNPSSGAFNPFVKVSGTTNDLVQMGTTIPTAAGLGIGSRGYGSSSAFDGYGKPGDGHIYSSNAQNGLNIISSLGTGTEDYIRFYAGKDADDGVCDMFIAGTGSTRGFVGVGTESPEEILHVEGGDILLNHDQNAPTSVNIHNLNSGIQARASLHLISDGESSINSGVIASFGTGYTGSGLFEGKYLPNSLTLATAGGGGSERGNINIGSRRDDGEIRFFAGGRDFIDDTIMGIWNGDGLTLSGNPTSGFVNHDFHLNTDTIQVRGGAINGYVLTATDTDGNAEWEEPNYSACCTTQANPGQSAWYMQLSATTGLFVDLGVTGQFISTSDLSMLNNTINAGDMNLVFGDPGTGRLNASTGVFTGGVSASTLISSSPLFINPSDEGNIIMGSSSGFSFNVLTKEATIKGSLTVGDGATTWNDGYLGNDEFISLLPSDFFHRGSGRNVTMAMEDFGGTAEPQSTLFAIDQYAMKTIPKGFQAYSATVYTDTAAGLPTVHHAEALHGNIETSTTTGVGTANADASGEIHISFVAPIVGTGSNYIGIQYTPSLIGGVAGQERVRGGKIYIQRT